MGNLGRILTIRVKITDPEKAKWIWDAHIGPAQHGVEVGAIADGDLFAERNQLRELVLDENSIAIPKKYYVKQADETAEEAIEAHCNGGFDTLENAKNDAPHCTDPGVKWDVIDITGKVYASGGG